MNRVFVLRRLWIVPLVLWTALIGASYIWNSRELERNMREYLSGEARQIFQIIVAARHGGVYGLRSGASPSNPYLEEPEKDIQTPDGKPLTLLNPAYMTRQLSEVIHDQSGIRIHITSLNPINPGNVALDWEAMALRRFEHGLDEYFDIAHDTAKPMARYMGPLVTRQACLRCHEKQGYKVGDIRGGISVSFNAEPALAVVRERDRDLALVHMAVWLLFTGLSLYGLHTIRRQFLALGEAKAQQDRLVEERTAQLRTEVRERKEAESYMRMLVNASGEAIFAVDKAGRCTLCNPMAVRLLGYPSPEEMQGVSVLALAQNHAHPDGDRTSAAEDAFPACAVLERGEYVHDDDAVFMRMDGQPLAVEYRAHPIHAEGEIVGAVITFSDITRRKAQQAEIWHKANHDPLTGLPNRELLADRLEGALAHARRHDGQVGLLFIDLDRFKEANDSLGHEAGDAILIEVTNRVRHCVRASDTVARLGGDEFVVLMPMPMTREDAETMADRIVEQIARPYVVDAGRAEISASVGIALYPLDADEADALLRCSDYAMYRAKDAGRNTWRVFHNGHGPD